MTINLKIYKMTLYFAAKEKTMACCSVACCECGLSLQAKIVNRIHVAVAFAHEQLMIHPCLIVFCQQCNCYSLWLAAPPRINNSCNHIVYSASLSEGQKDQVLQAQKEGRIQHQNQIFLVD